VFADRLRAAAETGILWGVKLALALGLVIVMITYLLNDYNIVRTRAANGQQAYDYITRQIDAAKPKPAP
jgi:hypothetical protein